MNEAEICWDCLDAGCEDYCGIKLHGKGFNGHPSWIDDNNMRHMRLGDKTACGIEIEVN